MKRNMAFKVTAFLLCVITLVTTALSVIGIIVLTNGDFYTRPYDTIRKNALYNTLYNYADTTAAAYHYGTIDRIDDLENRNFYYEMYDEGGALVASNYDGQEIKFTEIFYCYVDEWIDYGYSPDTSLTDSPKDTGISSDIDEETFSPDETFSPYEGSADPDYTGAISFDTGIDTSEADTYIDTLTDSENEIYGHYVTHRYKIVGYLPAEYFTTDTVSFIDYWLETFYSLKDIIYFIGGGSLLLFIIFSVVLCCCAGWKNGENKPKTCMFDKIPFDLFTVIYASVVCIVLNIFFDFYYEGFELVIAIVLAIIAFAVMLVSYLFSFAARAKTGELFKNTVIWFVLKNILRALRFILRAIGKVTSNLPVFAKSILILVIIGLWSFLLMLYSGHNIGFSIFLWVAGGTFLTIFALYIAYGFNKVKKGGERISRGDISHRINTEFMLPSIKKHAENINNIGLGMSAALDERLKSERFKTELITNVSHDLKTPLTSIVNYIDLLKTERARSEVDERKIDEYVEVLDRQSARLRKLTEDLVEASKASTGNLEVTPSPVELGEMIAQTEGEYAERLAGAGLELIVRRPEVPLTVMADGKHLWRIFDNLISNVCKYALSGTRVYIDICENAGRAYIIFRNTSKYELNMSGDELTERFVRGDASRHTEGSGLGLSIARSLAELNGGRMDIYIDGDLFKVVLGFDLMK